MKKKIKKFFKRLKRIFKNIVNDKQILTIFIFMFLVIIVGLIAIGFVKTFIIVLAILLVGYICDLIISKRKLFKPNKKKKQEEIYDNEAIKEELYDNNIISDESSENIIMAKKVNKKNKQLCNMHKNKSADKKIIEKTLEILRAVV